MKLKNYCLFNLYTPFYDPDPDLDLDLTISLVFTWTFKDSMEKAVEIAKEGHSKAPLAMEIISAVLGAGVTAGAATAGVLFLKPIIEKAVADAMANVVDAAAAEVLKQVASIATIAIGSAVIGLAAYMGIKHGIAAGMVAAREV